MISLMKILNSQHSKIDIILAKRRIRIQPLSTNFQASKMQNKYTQLLNLLKKKRRLYRWAASLRLNCRISQEDRAFRKGKTVDKYLGQGI
jgi:hypothetical protein